MAAPAVAAVAKKVIAYVVTDKKAMKVVGGIVLGVIVIICMPIADRKSTRLNSSHCL